MITPGKPIQLRFVVDEKSAWFGSSHMRSKQLMDIVHAGLGDAFRCGITNLPRSGGEREHWVTNVPRNAVLFFTKGSTRHVSQKLLAMLREHGAKTCLDYVDHDLRSALSLRPDIHVAASLGGESVLRQLMRDAGVDGQKIALLHHAADQEVRRSTNRTARTARAVYLGNPRNVHLPATLKKNVTVLNASGVSTFRRSLERLREFNLHYCIRPGRQYRNSFVKKPFVKGFTAAYCRSPVLVCSEDSEAMALLGSDYPFTSADLEKSSIMECYEYAVSEYRSPVWEKAMQQTEQLKQYCAPGTVANQFAQMIESLC